MKLEDRNVAFWLLIAILLLTLIRLPLISSSLLCSFLAAWVALALKISGIWIPAISLGLIMIPEVFFAGTVYPNTSIIAYAFIIAGHFFLLALASKPGWRLWIVALIYALGITCRSNSLCGQVEALLHSEQWFIPEDYAKGRLYCRNGNESDPSIERAIQ